jgi:hypothetical protein
MHSCWLCLHGTALPASASQTNKHLRQHQVQQDACAAQPKQLAAESAHPRPTPPPKPGVGFCQILPPPPPQYSLRAHVHIGCHTTFESPRKGSTLSQAGKRPCQQCWQHLLVCIRVTAAKLAQQVQACASVTMNADGALQLTSYLGQSCHPAALPRTPQRLPQRLQHRRTSSRG